MTPSGAVIIVCINPDCGSENVQYDRHGEFGCMHCLDCGERWNEEQQPKPHDREPHKRLAKMKESIR